ncbi:Sorting nexin-41 [Rhodotorula toruloides ATCC 204091]|uniref:BY PROTMAP: gi/342319290/gb/EGU11239.1/ Sorting nexin-41 [Rhodotorula glutinis ATCC 204091] n=1 Tax=Rhodotorula toruloides TaxID=5286 RepID=A0A0K3C5G5_RHOTO|nr:Sorting nexin-41 [Rhodotorula toruloides ATCC 204091]
MPLTSDSDSDTESSDDEQAVPMLACRRLSPRPCINQALVDELKPLREFRFLQYGTHAKESISYATAVSCIIGTPFKIETVEQAAKIPKIGEKLTLKIQEFLDYGFIKESRYAKANELYERGVRTLEDLRRAMNRPRIKSYLKYYDDMQEKYRRGKEFSNDVDILFTYPHRDGEERGVLQALVERMQQKNLIPEDGILTLTTCGTDRTITPNRSATLLDALDKALIIFRHPANGTTRVRDKYRRVDLVVTTWREWGSAVVGWTGSTQFERDLRRHAKRINLKFDSGGIRNRTTDEPVEAVTEKDVFRVLGLDYIPYIVDALKTSEGASTPYIVYRIVFENREVRRRYSDFVSLRQALATLHPCFIVPPLPPKNSLSSYAIAGANPAKAKEDAALIARRRRMLSTFLNRTLEHPVLGQERVFRRFLDPETPWHDVLHSPPVTLVPKNPLKAPANDPTNAEMLALFASLPIPSSSATLQHPDQRFLDSEVFTSKFSSHLAGSMEKVNRRLMKRWTEAAGDWGEMGGGLNGFALRMGEDGSGGLDEATEKVGMAVDAGYTLTNTMLKHWEQEFTEPLQEYTQFSNIIKSLLKYRHNKHLQYEAARELLESKRGTLEELERSELEAQRLEKALERVRIVTEDGGSDRAVSPPSGSSPVGAAAESGAQAPLPPLPSSSGSLAPQPAKRGGGLVSALKHSVKGLVDSDPESTRRSTISKTREQINQLDDAIKALTGDLRFASVTIQSDLDRFQRQKVGDIREMCLDFANFHKEWASKVRSVPLVAVILPPTHLCSQNLAMWEETKAAIDAIVDDE